MNGHCRVPRVDGVDTLLIRIKLIRVNPQIPRVVCNSVGFVTQLGMRYKADSVGQQPTLGVALSRTGRFCSDTDLQKAFLLQLLNNL